MECNEYYLHCIIWGGEAQNSLVAKYSVLMTHDCFLEIEGRGEKKSLIRGHQIQSNILLLLW